MTTGYMNIAFAINDKYSQHLEVTLFSLLKYNPKNRFIIYIISADISKKSLNRLERICQKMGNAKISLIDLDENVFKGFKVLEHFSRDMYSRYLLPNLLPDEDKVLYLDADILITGDISQLYEIDIRRNSAAAVRDIGIEKKQFKDYLKALGLNGSKYYNSGVLLLNLEKLRRNRSTEKMIKKTNKLSHLLRHPDQDIINIVIGKDIKEVDRSWNYQDEDRKRNITKNPKIIHYTTAQKPWNTAHINRGYNSEAHILYEEAAYEYMRMFNEALEVSIVVPVYNTSPEYVDVCLESILKQTYRNIEVILVDDGSNQKTARYLDTLARSDSRIRVLHKKNAGTHRARQAGVEASVGEYIAFVDSDDKIEKSYVYKLYVACRDSGAEMSMCESWDDIYFPLTPSTSQSVNEVITGNNKIATYSVTGFPGFRLPGGVVWARLYARQLVDTLDWDASDYKITEDEFVMTQLLAVTSKVSIVHDQLYYYRRQSNSNKEAIYSKNNIFNGKPIPMAQTPADLYEKTRYIFEQNHIQCDNQLLMDRYIWMMNRFISNLYINNNLDVKNRDELRRHTGLYLETILSSALPYEQRVRAAIVLQSPDALEIYNRMINDKKRESSMHITELTQLHYENSVLNEKFQNFLGIKRSARLFAGNIKRKIRLRTRLRKLLS